MNTVHVNDGSRRKLLPLALPRNAHAQNSMRTYRRDHYHDPIALALATSQLTGTRLHYGEDK